MIRSALRGNGKRSQRVRIAAGEDLARNPGRKSMKVLGIETSCDDTSVALYDSDSGVAENLVSSQVDLHDHFGGVVPELASRAHLVNLLPLVDYLLERQKITLKDLVT